ncbi:cysteinyl-tRNA synthetase [Sinobacterium caligoides]|uniref:Cysteine--tRNA ligase n=1 Tax=Sinobacterium caligoides TaxID=933926 RepID=A0A3N2DXY2_9GAMM|nr:cysteine--tRNA ligase [Sinobacterium caligoides]ROS04654.1 cysteinyl-tRNA synthetase [Sinobacterium caligoides]
MALKIYSTLSNSKQEFVPLEEGKIRMYVCGMTVYDYCHLGHARVLVAFDVITKYMRASGYDVTYVRNITDIDDKIINRAADNGEAFTDLTDRFIAFMHEDEKALGVARPDIEPRATAYIDEIIAMTQNLIEKGYAYACDNGDVYYRVAKFEGYGKLSNKNPEELLAGARIETGDIKEDPRDFALWKSANVDDVSWPSPWGAGRPGWHIECSAMTKCCLGETFDIHGGGPDLPFPHHENEIAQSEAANDKEFARYWMHAGAVRVDGEKMSKSLGNFFTIREILEKYHHEVVRYVLVRSHYRSPINYSEENLKTAKVELDRLYTGIRGYEHVKALDLCEFDDENSHVKAFREAMDDDFNTALAISVLFEAVRELNTATKQQADNADDLAQVLKSMAATLGLLLENVDSYMQSGLGGAAISAEQIDTLIAERIQAKADRNFQRADEVRDLLKEQGVVLEDGAGGTTWRRE